MTTEREEQKRLDREAMRYLHAVEHRDFDTLAEIYRAAETDSALDEMIQGLNRELVREADGQKIYRGFRLDGICCVLVNAELLDPKPSQAIWNHSPDGFE